MIFFPQLSSGAVAQLPLRRETGYRTLVNRTLDGREVRVADGDYFELGWELRLELLTDAEFQAIQTLFTATEGRLKSFTFLEAGENLLAWSENFTESVWAKTGVTVTGGVGDPFGGTLASRLTGSGSISQSLSIPAKLRYAASIWAKTSQTGAAFEITDNAGQTATAELTSDGAWRRYRLSTAWTASISETMIFRVTLPAGATVDVYGAQVEAHPAASYYKKTIERGGVHPGARFASDTLVDRATEPGRHAGVIRITWTPSVT